MSKGPWKFGKKKKETVLNFGGASEPIEAARVSEGPEPIHINADRPTQPPPLPPLGAAGPAGPGPSAAAPNPAPSFDDAKLQAGLARAFVSVVNGLGNAANYALRNTQYSVEVVEVTLPEGELWAVFACPVLKQLMPDIEKNPVAALAVITGMILSGKIKVKNKGGNYGNTAATEPNTSS